MSKYKVTAHRLNVRKEPKLTGKVVGVIEKDDVVEVLSISGDEYWYKVQNNEGLKGWSSHKYLVSLENENIIGDDELPWMPIAIREIGVREYTGAADNPRIVEYLHSTTLGEHARSNDETYWCSAFVNWCVEKAGYAGTDSAWARTWGSWGESVTTPERGCIVVFKRGRGGHVGFYISETENEIEVLGGNQDDSVCIKPYPKSRFLSYQMPRRP